ncbi:MAG: hypothetical protein MAG795_01207 [Candidatus Woesearchaeota archaeon]|nr:hypothetical protein [Candidatus Woesearchaeota archaeon]
MKKPLKEVINEVKYDDLIKLRKDLEKGGLHTKSLVTQKLKDIEINEMKVCATCGVRINPYKLDEYVLFFGPSDFKKKGYFCGKDCLKHFLNKH